MVLKSWKEKLLTVGICIIFVLFVGYSIYAFLDQNIDVERYTTYFLVITAISGIIGIIIGMIVKVESVGTGLVGGGILSILYGVIRYWKDSNSLLKVVALGIALGVLVWFGLKKFGTTKKRK